MTACCRIDTSHATPVRETMICCATKASYSWDPQTRILLLTHNGIDQRVEVRRGVAEVAVECADGKMTVTPLQSRRDMLAHFEWDPQLHRQKVCGSHINSAASA